MCVLIALLVRHKSPQDLAAQLLRLRGSTRGGASGRTLFAGTHRAAGPTPAEVEPPPPRSSHLRFPRSRDKPLSDTPRQATPVIE